MQFLGLLLLQQKTLAYGTFKDFYSLTNNFTQSGNFNFFPNEYNFF